MAKQKKKVRKVTTYRVRGDGEWWLWYVTARFFDTLIQIEIWDSFFGCFSAAAEIGGDVVSGLADAGGDIIGGVIDAASDIGGDL